MSCIKMVYKICVQSVRNDLTTGCCAKFFSLLGQVLFSWSFALKAQLDNQVLQLQHQLKQKDHSATLPGFR